MPFTLNLLPRAFNRGGLSSDHKFDQIDDVGESPPAEQEDVFRRPNEVANVVDIDFLESDEDVMARHERPKSISLPPHSAR